MDLNELVYRRLSSDSNIAGSLAKFADEPAIFNTEFPNDQDEGWGGMTQYPRISYQFNWQIDMDRASAGTLSVSVYTEKDPILCERLELFVRDTLKDVLMKAEGQAPVCVSWARTDPYLLEGNAILCKSIEFDILEYPLQESTDPDPIMALSTYIKELVPDSVVLGIDRIGAYTNPADAPIFYCRLENLQFDPTGYCQNTITWYNCQISVHLLCPDASLRLKLIAGINQRLTCDGEVIMLDTSPMTIRGTTVNNRADYLRSGQLTVNAHYGCLKDVFAVPKVRAVEIAVNGAN
jgi:hypothetical protein